MNKRAKKRLKEPVLKDIKELAGKGKGKAQPPKKLPERRWLTPRLEKKRG